MKILLAIAALLAPAAAFAADPVSLSSEVLVERVRQEPDGKATTVLEAPKVVTPGEKLVFFVNYRNGGAEPATGFVVTNPIPDAVAFASAEGDAVVSIDGGKSWGALASLQVKQADGSSRAALPGDVTHVRWTFAQAIPAGHAGKVTFRGVVK
jgi:uncharacterized repeat protein (TIGR01451 family)